MTGNVRKRDKPVKKHWKKKKKRETLQKNWNEKEMLNNYAQKRQKTA